MKKGNESSSNEAKLFEEKHKEMNNLIGLNNVSIKEKPTLLINDWCAEHIKTLHKEYPSTEWLACCKVVPQGNGVFLMTDMLFPQQRTTGGDVETAKGWMEWLNKQLIERGEKATDWNCILHSHHHMGVFWSGTDDNARKGLNDGRQLAWAVVTAYNEKGIDYKGCLNFYKPYNIEIDAVVKNADERSLIGEYNEYLAKVDEKQGEIYDRLLQENNEYIESITEKPSYTSLLNYLGIDITAELNENYNEIKSKIGNPELLEYLKQLQAQAKEMAIEELGNAGEYNDMLAEYGAFCNWSDNLLTQLENNKEKSYTTGTLINSNIVSQANVPSNRDFEDEYYNDYYFTSPDYSEAEVRAMIGIGFDIPMKLGRDKEWQAWSNWAGQYMYVEDWAEQMWY